MNLRLSLFLPAVLLAGVLFGQNSQYNGSATTFAYNSDPEAFEHVVRQLNQAEKDYSFGESMTTIYDTLILNTLDFSPEEIPTYRPEVLSRRLYEMPTVIRMDYNEYVQSFIDLYTITRREQVSRMMGLSKIYFPLFEEELDKAGMPIELKYLPIVESALNPHARSRVGATGLWQFMYATGKQYGLQVNSFVDQRKDPKKSTVAALKYLKNAFEQFGDWQLAIASYNCGAGNVRKAIARSGGRRNFWEIRRYLPRETRGYVPAFIAATYAFNYASQHNIYPTLPDFDLYQDTLHLERMDITLSEIAKMTGADIDLLRNLNPELKLERVPYSPKPYVLLVPPKVAEYFARFPHSIRKDYGKRRDAAPAPMASSKGKTQTRSYVKPKGNLVYHRVRKGEAVSVIAERYGVSSRKIAEWNYLRRYRIKEGQKLKIYTTKSAAAIRAASQVQPAAPTTSPRSINPSGNAVFHSIKNGETLWSIANKYQVTVDQIQSLNHGLKPKKMKPGQTIRIK